MNSTTPSGLKEFTLRETGRKILLRRLQTHHEYHMCVGLQEATWGEGFPDLVPTSILMVTQKIGGLTAGAFDDQGLLVGFVFGMMGYMKGESVHWSDMLAVRQEFRGYGIGTQLKIFQREEVLKIGVSRIYWTFDPLVARNAHFNLNHLGADIEEYIPDMYADEGSELHRGLGMDRCIAVWKITSPKAQTPGAAISRPYSGLVNDLPIVNVEQDRHGDYLPVVKSTIAGPEILIEVPQDIHAVRRLSGDTAKRWRESTRHAFLHYLQVGYHVSSFIRRETDKRCFYLLKS